MAAIKPTMSAVNELWDNGNANTTLNIAPPAGDSPASANTPHKAFSELLEQGIQEVNATSRAADKASMDLASGKNSNIHETMLAVTKAELGFQMMVQVRNKMIEAYQDVMRMQV
jgi:flagellar hook-basal body complex protein FliE